MHVVSCGPEKSDLAGGFLGAAGFTGMVRGTAQYYRGRGPLKANTPEEKEAIKEDKACFLQCRALGKRVVEMAKITRAGYEAVPRDELVWARGSLTDLAYDYFAGKKA